MPDEAPVIITVLLRTAPSREGAMTPPPMGRRLVNARSVRTPEVARSSGLGRSRGAIARPYHCLRPTNRTSIRPSCEHMFVPGIVTCVLLPRFSLATASGERKELLTQPVALAPEPGGRQQVGEVSLAAEAYGIHS